MQAHLSAATDVGTFIVFDPAALAASDYELNSSQEKIVDLAKTGKAFFYSFASDGEVTFLVTSEKTDDWLKACKGESISGALLRVPSGRLVATGLEELPRIKHWSSDSAVNHVQMGEECVIDPGDYTVDAFELDWNEELEEALIAQRMGASNVRFELILGTSMGCLIVFTLFALPALFFIAKSMVSLNAAFKLLISAAILHVLFWPIALLLMKSERWTKIQALRKEIKTEHPDVILLLKRSDAKSGAFKPGLLGIGMRRFQT